MNSATLTTLAILAMQVLYLGIGLALNSPDALNPDWLADGQASAALQLTADLLAP